MIMQYVPVVPAKLACPSLLHSIIVGLLPESSLEGLMVRVITGRGVWIMRRVRAVLHGRFTLSRGDGSILLSRDGTVRQFALSDICPESVGW